MAGAILELISNEGMQNRWINGDPQITFFKKVYRRHTSFATELVRLSFDNEIDFGNSGRITLLPSWGFSTSCLPCFGNSRTGC